MIDVVKKTFLAGLGATVVTAERVESVLEDLVQRGKLSADEAKEVASKLATEGKEEYSQFRSSMGQFFDEMLGKANVATKKDLASIEARLAGIEAVLSEKDSKGGKQSKSSD